MARYASEWHEPIMVDEVLDYLRVAPGGRYIDGTLGGGGHTHAILDACAPDGKVLSIDRDPTAIAFARERLAAYGDRVEFAQGNYGDVLKIATEHGFLPADGFLVDAGVSSRQLDDAERGFSFRDSGPLDMRMGEDAPTLADYLDSVEDEDLARVLKQWGEVKHARPLARKILAARKAGELETTADLAQLVERSIGYGAGSGRKTKIHPATLVFQALRIAINRELETLERAVYDAPEVLRPGGRAVFISFHSLEDRIVKQGFRDLGSDSTPAGVPITEDQTSRRVNILTSRPVTSQAGEIEANPRARSAKLRAIELL